MGPVVLAVLDLFVGGVSDEAKASRSGIATLNVPVFLDNF